MGTKQMPNTRSTAIFSYAIEKLAYSRLRTENYSIAIKIGIFGKGKVENLI